MDVLSLQIFVSLVLVFSSILLFAYAAKGRDHEHADRLSLLPLDAERTAIPPEPRDAPSVAPPPSPRGPS